MRDAAPATTVVIPVRDEERNLYAFFSFLERVTNYLGSRREFVVVVNGCTDGSAGLARTLAADSPLDVRVVSSEPGIVPAFRAGIAARTLTGFVGKLDADVIVHPLALDALEMHLLADARLRVTHAEPLPSDTFCAFAEPEHRPEAVSSRRYFNGKASLYRDDPFGWPDVTQFPERLRAEDVFFSFYLTFFVGPESIGLAPGAVVYQKTIRSMEDLTRMLSRAGSEIQRLTAAFPGFAPLNLFFDQKVFSRSYRELLALARNRTEEADEWLRLESTK